MQKNRIPLRIAVGAIRFYQAWKGTGLVPATCRFIPSCSDYALQAIEKHGLLQGIRMAVRRIFRCRPGVVAGHDPVY